MKLHATPFLSLAALILSLASAQAAVTLPYSNTFDSDDGNFVTTAGTWSIGGGNYQSSQTAMATYGSMVQADGAALTNFSLTTTFISPDLSQATFLGFALLADTSNLGSATIDYYLADVQSNGTVRILSFENGASVVNGLSSGSATSLAGGLKINTEYTMTVTGATNAGVLSLSFSITDGTNTGSVTATDTSPLNTASNQWFGFRNRQGFGSPSDSLVVNYHDFSLSAVPEPTSAGLLALGLAVGALRQRRRHR